MSDVYVIEIEDRAAGLVARAEDGVSYRFHAALPFAFALDGQLFRTPDEAQAAVRTLLAGSPADRRQPLDRAA